MRIKFSDQMINGILFILTFFIDLLAGALNLFVELYNAGKRAIARVTNNLEK